MSQGLHMPLCDRTNRPDADARYLSGLRSDPPPAAPRKLG